MCWSTTKTNKTALHVLTKLQLGCACLHFFMKIIKNKSKKLKIVFKNKETYKKGKRGVRTSIGHQVAE